MKKDLLQIRSLGAGGYVEQFAHSVHDEDLIDPRPDDDDDEYDGCLHD